ncbi:MAG: extracellular solute-binding protein [Anaerolineae bacterium]|nr:extracellular solute-binding protein [Anaerolineae bacterium]
METITLSVFDHGEEPMAVLRDVLQQFEAEHGVGVDLEVLPWEGGWGRMMRQAISEGGIDVSEVGSTWIGDFASSKMDALYTFNRYDIDAMGGEKGFLPAAWQSGIPASRSRWAPSRVWGVPWLADTRVVFYRRDILERAGIDVTTAFETAAAFEETVARLQASGVRIPLVLPTLRVRISVHLLACWVWGAGGDFLTPDGRQVLISAPEARAGMKAYFSLGRYLPEDVHAITDHHANELFWQGEAAMTVSGHWILTQQQGVPEVTANLEAALPPGVPFVGGLSLVIWGHTRHRKLAGDLVRFMVHSDTALSLYPLLGPPARLDRLDQPPFSDDPRYRVLAEALRTGRSFSSGHMWGMLESLLADEIPLIWQDVLTSPESVIEDIIDTHLERVASRFADASGGV